MCVLFAFWTCFTDVSTERLNLLMCWMLLAPTLWWAPGGVRSWELCPVWTRMSMKNGYPTRPGVHLSSSNMTFFLFIYTHSYFVHWSCFWLTLSKVFIWWTEEATPDPANGEGCQWTAGSHDLGGCSYTRGWSSEWLHINQNQPALSFEDNRYQWLGFVFSAPGSSGFWGRSYCRWDGRCWSTGGSEGPTEQTGQWHPLHWGDLPSGRCRVSTHLIRLIFLETEMRMMSVLISVITYLYIVMFGVP